jgi:hypothetical protein
MRRSQAALPQMYSSQQDMHWISQISISDARTHS